MVLDHISKEQMQAKPKPDPEQDTVREMRGIMLGMVISLVIWGGLALWFCR